MNAACELIRLRQRTQQRVWARQLCLCISAISLLAAALLRGYQAGHKHEQLAAATDKGAADCPVMGAVLGLELVKDAATKGCRCGGAVGLEGAWVAVHLKPGGRADKGIWLVDCQASRMPYLEMHKLVCLQSSARSRRQQERGNQEQQVTVLAQFPVERHIESCSIESHTALMLA